VSMTLRPYVEAIMSDARYDSIALSCNHLYDDRHYVHIYSAIWNGVDMVDPRPEELHPVRAWCVSRRSRLFYSTVRKDSVPRHPCPFSSQVFETT